jgi:hypothetical protein
MSLEFFDLTGAKKTDNIAKTLRENAWNSHRLFAKLSKQNL